MLIVKYYRVVVFFFQPNQLLYIKEYRIISSTSSVPMYSRTSIERTAPVTNPWLENKSTGVRFPFPILFFAFQFVKSLQ